MYYYIMTSKFANENIFIQLFNTNSTTCHGGKNSFKSFKDKDYRLNFSQRFGIYNNIRTLENPIWFHAVSLGEVISSKKLLVKFVRNNEVILTVSTPTGLREAKKFMVIKW